MRNSSPVAGTLIDGKYRVERVLGQGGMGVVVEATHVTLGTRVAVKLLRSDVADADVRERFAREGQIAAQLAGEHIARVTDTGQTEEGDPYLVMEFLVGRDLSVELEARKQLPVAEAVDLVLQACEGVAEAHAVGLVHRDIKPANLFLVRRRDGSPLIKVLDFGLTKILHSQARHLTATTSSFGTPQYMSPEQISSSKYVDARTDQHALAMVLYELITGAPPYEAETVPALFVVIATRMPAPMRKRRPDVHPGLEAALLRALAKSPDERFPSLTEFAAAIAPYGSAEATGSGRRISVTLTAPGDMLPAHREPSRASFPTPPLTSDDQSATLKKVDASLSQQTTMAVMEPDTHSPLESDPRRTNGARNRRLLAIASAVAVLGLGAIFLARVIGSTSTTDTPIQATSASAPAASTGPEVTPAGTLAPAVPSATPSTSVAATASATASAKGSRPPTRPLKGTNAGSSSSGTDPGQVFGTRNKPR